MKNKINLWIFVTAISFLFGCAASEPNNPGAENKPATERMKKDIAASYGTHAWYNHITNLSVKNNADVEVYTNLSSVDEAAKSICDGLSFTAYTYDGSNHKETIFILGQDNRALIERKGIDKQCR